jgi:glycosyltransferase involved in cell wall biosynthesis
VSESRAPFFTVGIPAFCAEGLVGETIESVLAQTWTDWELVVVDDGSSDATYEVAAAYADRDPRIRVLRVEHAGCGAARNAAYEGSRAPFLCRLDQDDLYLPEYLETMHGFIEEHPGYQIFSCNAERMFADGRTEPMLTAERWSSPSSVTFDELIDHNPIFAMAVIRRETYWKVGGTRSALVDDYDFWMRALLDGARHIYVPKVLARYRIHAAQGSARNDRMLESRIAVLEEVAAREGLSPERVQHCRSMVAVLKRRLLEQKIRYGDTKGILRLFREAKPAYNDMPRYYAALAAGMLSERLLARVALRGRRIDPHVLR